MKRFLLAVLAFAVPALADAQTWTQLPDGTMEFHTNYATSGTFLCRHGPLATGTCTANNNRLTLTSGSAILDIVFNGTSQPLSVATETGGHQVDLGTLTTTLSGQGAFLFPTIFNVNAAPIFFFYLTVASTMPVSQDTWKLGFMSTGGTEVRHDCCGYLGADYIALATGDPGTVLIYDSLSPMILHAETETQVIQARVGLAPEPGSMVLLATGLAGMAAIGKRRWLS